MPGVTTPASPPESTGATQRAIESHYDVSRDFYRLWLDPRMVYSCALWPGHLDDDLGAAQVAKLSWHADAARAGAARRALDVGCGWGAMLRFLRDDRGVPDVTGLTLSGDQAAATQHEPGINVLLQDWRQHQPNMPYDVIVSIGAFEHFARPELTQQERRDVYRQFFANCASWLSEGGRLSLQSIAWEDRTPGQEGPVFTFFTEDIFPESQLPQLSDIVVSSEPYFRLLALRNDGGHYSHTLELWQHRLEGAKAQAIELVGRETYRRYVRYLRVSRAMFDRRVCTLYRLAFERRPPVTSGWGAPPTEC